MQKIEETSFFKRVIISIKDFERYPELAAQNGIHVFFYAVKLLLIMAIIIGSVIAYRYFGEIQEGIEYLKKEIPDFTYEEGKLSVDTENPIIIENDNSNIIQQVIIDTREDVTEETIENYKTKIEKSTTAAIILKDKIFVKALTLVETNYKDILKTEEITKLNKQEILDVYLTTQNQIILCIGLLFVIAIQTFFINLIDLFLYALLIGLLSYMTAILLRIRLKLKAMIKMAVHALTFPTILFLIYSIINVFTGFYIKYFTIMYVGVAYIYMVASILIIKSDLIKRKAELEKIIEEQAKIALEEQEEKKEEKEEEPKEEKPKEQEQEEKKDKTKRKKKDIGDVAGGTAVIKKERKEPNEQ